MLGEVLCLVTQSHNDSVVVVNIRNFWVINQWLLLELNSISFEAMLDHFYFIEVKHFWIFPNLVNTWWCFLVTIL